MKVAVVGSRDYRRLDLVRSFVAGLHADTVVVSGGARGVDTEAEEAAEARGLEVVVLEPEWDRLGRAAGLIRNKDIVNAADRVVGFWDGASRGTVHSLRLAVKSGKPVLVFGPTGEVMDRGPWSR